MYQIRFLQRGSLFNPRKNDCVEHIFRKCTTKLFITVAAVNTLQMIS